MTLGVFTVEIDKRGGIENGAQRAVQLAHVNGQLGLVNFRYEPVLTLSPHSAYMLLLALVSTLVHDFGYTLEDDSTLQRNLKKTT